MRADARPNRGQPEYVGRTTKTRITSDNNNNDDDNYSNYNNDHALAPVGLIVRASNNDDNMK